MEIADPGKSPEEILEAAEDREALAKAMNQLPVEYRQILTMRAINDMSYTEIAEALQLREGTVKSRLSRARLALRNLLVKPGNKSNSETSISTGRRDRS